jgi:RsmE family RNA methyltransferase
LNLILIEPDELRPDGIVVLRDARAVHLVSVLKATSGQTIRIGLLDGPFGVGTVTTIGDASVTMACAFEAAVPPRPAIDLLLAVPRPKVMRRLWAQLAALGVGRVILTNASRVERNYFDTHFLAPTIYRPLLIEGLQQARDTRLPLVSIHRQFRILVEDGLDRLSDATVRLMADPGGDISRPQPEATRTARQRVLLAVGPEGGWNDFERDLLASRGFIPISMGTRTLRTDTACVALLALVHNAIAAA